MSPLLRNTAECYISNTPSKHIFPYFDAKILTTILTLRRFSCQKRDESHKGDGRSL